MSQPMLPQEVSARPAASRALRARHQRVEWLPGWPLVVLYAAFPLWWIAGLGILGFFIAAVPMAFYLLRTRPILVPRGFGVWLLFLAWVLAGAFMLWVDVPGTVPVAGLGRLFPYAYRLLWYVVLTVVLLYVINLPEQDFPRVRVYRLLSLLFLTTVAGGYLGRFAPRLDIPSLMEVVLPRSVSANSFLSQLIDPSTAQVQGILGYEIARPTAPWVYANDWGANFGLLLPFFVLAWWGIDAGWRRRWFPLLALLALPPVIFSLNRGLWLGLAVVGAYVIGRAVLMGKIGAALSLSAAAGAATLVVLASPLGQLLMERLDNPHSNDGRGNLAALAVETVASTSPFVGLGAPREIQGNFFSIAGGDSAACVGCSLPQLGTQGYSWSLIFETGIVGTALFVTFVLLSFARGMRSRSWEATALTSVGVYLAVVVWVYDLLGPPLVTVFITLALLWRINSASPHEADTDEADSTSPPQLLETRQAGSRPAPKKSTTAPLRSSHAAGESMHVRLLSNHISFFSRHSKLLVVGCAVGLATSAFLVLSDDVQYEGTTLVYSRQIAITEGGRRAVSIDSDAQLAESRKTLSAAASAVGFPGGAPALADNLVISALPNSRILRISVTAPSAGTAQRASEAVADWFLLGRKQLVAASVDAELANLDSEIASLDRRLQAALRRPAGAAGSISTPSLARGLATSLTLLEQERRALVASASEVGAVIETADLGDQANRGGARATVVSGVGLGLLLAIAAGSLRDASRSSEPISAFNRRRPSRRPTP